MQTATIDRTKEWTVEDYLHLDEGLLAQLIDGELIMSPAPTPKHQRLIRKLYDILKNEEIGEFFFSPIDLYIDKRTVFQPDLVFISNSKNYIISERGIEGPPDLVIEVVSPSNSFLDRNSKKRKYLEFGVKEYWIVDQGNKTLEIYTDDLDKPSLYLAGEGTVTSTVLTKISFELHSIFE
jgi:Uma2 family endonuclease